MLGLGESILVGVYLAAAVAALALPLERLAGRRGAVAAGLLSSLLVAVAAFSLALAPPAATGPGEGGLFAARYRVDDVTRVYAAVLGLVGPLVTLYSLGYMDRGRGLGRYYAFLGLFQASMLGLVAADSLGLLYLYWELVGLASFVLIGYYYYSPRAARAALKAFTVTRVGDLGLLLGIAAAWQGGVGLLSGLGGLDPRRGVLVASGMLLAAAAKSAQLPLSIWLPDAMEGPTPVSALLHSATMVAAGVYLASRAHCVPGAAGLLEGYALLAAVTAVYGAAAAAAQVDAKRLLAYSTISNLGLMNAAAVYSPAAAAALVAAHAYSKALLFLDVGVAVHELEPLVGPERARLLDVMAGVARGNVLMAAATVVGAASLAGLPPFGGFFAKEEVVEALPSPLLRSLVVAAALGAGFYCAKLVYYLLLRGGGPLRPRTGVSMAVPVAVLTAAAALPPWLLAPLAPWPGAGFVGAVAAAVGVAAAFAAYWRGIVAPRGLWEALLEGLYLDEAFRLAVPVLYAAAGVAGRGLAMVAEEASRLLYSAAAAAGRGAEDSVRVPERVLLAYVLGLAAAVALALAVALIGGGLAW